MCDRLAIQHTRALAGFTSGRPSDSREQHEANHARALARRGASHEAPPHGSLSRTPKGAKPPQPDPWLVSEVSKMHFASPLVANFRLL